MFKVSRNDDDILVISNKFVEELRTQQDDRISAIGAHIKVSIAPGMLVLKHLLTIHVESAWQILLDEHLVGERPA